VIRGSGELGSVFYWCHDPPAVVVRFRDVREFLEHLTACIASGNEEGIFDDPVEMALTVWRSRESTKLARDLCGSRDQALSDFARSLEPTSKVADLRASALPCGFAWGLFGPNSVVRRLGQELVFAVSRP